MTGSGAIGLQLVLLLALWGPPEAQTLETTAPSENISEKTTGISTPKQSWNSTTLEFSSTGPSSTMATEKLPFLNETIIIEGFPKVSQTKSITLHSPAELELMCSLVISNSTNTAKMETVWNSQNATFNPETIRRNETHSKWCTRYTIKVRNDDQMRNYTCVYKTTPEIKATFVLQVPQVYVKSENIISYVGDIVVLTCDVGDGKTEVNPSFWIWYSNNGSGEVVINSTLMPEKYSFIQTPANTTKLKIFDLSELDTSSYWCKARFPLGESKGEVSLKVLTYLVPLKPFLIIAAEVIVLVSLVFIFEVVSKKKQGNTEVEKEFEQVETLKSEDSNGVENSTTRHRNV
ncbi:embigin isoform X2 [Thamnophis elegans]|uniref:embigin isoform X2 n=1 Tax=Thamnophis elegans TaxID=35005 RepID=UPI0013767402|nr:embigin isoform X2 [Thamnophis elegans]